MYVVATTVKPADPVRFREQIDSVVRPTMTTAGAAYVAGLEAVIAAEASGMFIIGSRWADVDTAMDGLDTFYRSPAVHQALADNPITFVSRNLSVVEQERGNPAGKYAVIFTSTISAPDPARESALHDDVFGLMSRHGINGMRTLHVMVSGATGGGYNTLFYTDSAQSYMNAVAEVYKDPTISGHFAAVGLTPTGRFICRCH